MSTSMPTGEPKTTPDDVGQQTAIAIKDDEPPAKAHISNYWRILSHRTTTDGVALLTGLCCAVGAGTALPLMNIVFGHLVGNFNNYFIPGSDVTEAEFKSSVRKNALYIVYLFIGKFVLTYVSMFCWRTTGLRISANLRLAYIKALFAQPIRKLDEMSAGTITNTITTSANTIQISVSDKLHGLFMSMALTVSAYAIAFRYSWAMTLVTSSAILFVLLVYCITTPILIKKLQRVEKANEKAASIAGEVFASIRAVLSLGAQQALTDKYFARVDEAKTHGLALSLQLAMQLAPIFFSMYSTFALAFWFGLKLFREGHIASISTVIIVFFSVLIVVSVLGTIAAPIMAITKAISVSTEFFSMIDAITTSPDGLTDKDISPHDDILLQDIWFSYPTRPNVQVLKGFTARFPKGKTTALVGPSGSGKSTIVALLERWYDLKDESETAFHASQTQDSESKQEIVADDRGAIVIGAHDISYANVKWWRSQIGLVQQEPFLFNDTIFNNVAFGLLGTKWEQENEAAKKVRVERACKEAFADEFIQQLPKRYDTKVGESGIKLSGGQRQRLAIARSIVREPAILILDEATSSIDVRGERIVQQALDRVSRDRTTIVIAHRLSTIRKADNIIVMRDGRNIEEGTHEYLLAIPDGLYAGLVHAQQLESESTYEALKPEKYTTNNPDQEYARSITEPDAEASTTAYKQKGFFGSFGRFMYEQRRHWKIYLLILASAMGAGSAFSLQSWLFAQLIQVFQFTGARLKEQGDFWSLMFFVLALCVGAFYFSLGFNSNHVSVYVATAYRREYFTNILRNPVPFFDREGNASGSLMSRLSTDPKVIQELLGLNGVVPLIAIFNMTGCIAIAFSFGWKLTLVTFFSAMPVIWIAAFVRIRFDLQFEAWNAKVFVESSQFATEAIGAFRTVTSLTMEASIVNKYSELLRDQIRKSTRKAIYAALVFALSDSIELCGMALTYWPMLIECRYGGQLLASHEYNPLQFFVIYVAIVQGAQGAGQFLSFAPDIAQATAAANRMLSIRGEISEREKAIVKGQTLQHTDVKTGASVEFHHVTFQYPTRDTPIYRDLNLSIQAGQFVAFVGPSGCGKTTVISLLERFYDPISGCISLNGQNVRNIETASYRRALSLVAQEPKLFDGTIRENLLLGLGKSVSDERIVQACKDAEIHDFVVSLPDGYATALGINTQTALSGGQKQRLCLARALLREPMLLLLDEATSSLDSQSEKLVQGAIERLVGQRSMTVIAVAHRLATIQKADVIFVFGESEVGHGSRVVEQGTHHDLLRRRGAYWQMVSIQ
ncbi:ATP-binding cassette, subfamily B, member 1, partial [Exophiala viscosa]|uniref:ATP-binding cassette, subfamily B, member 1 n=1 Tax=Exophiala viscosa TaxID=2486360 RepID=UPI0021A00ADB